ncbi:hypothetical protein [Lacibacter sp.]|uniref:hypothetical protein n=1 Tax=Lacibacter sp. TaxID=1915409 RepID=UPI002B4B2FA9|nr:hypothetical protein [Lacibacter sp.]HLP37435.1 hypothetical protein [Lacibacter sp.]
MFSCHLPKGFERIPVRLTDEEQKATKQIIADFFGAYHLDEIRNHLGALTEIALTKDNSYYDTARERDHVLWFYYQVERMIEAMWVEERRRHKEQGGRKKIQKTKYKRKAQGKSR